MVSSSSSSSAKVPAAVVSPPQPSLSYADHAKKAQNINNALSSKPHPRLTTTTTPTSPSTSNNPPLKSAVPSTPSTSVDVTPSSSVILTRPQTRAVSPSPPSAGTSEMAKPGPVVADGKGINGGDAASPSTASLTTATTAAPAPKPVVNVWSLRKEQMAQALAHAQQAQQQQSPSSSSRPTQNAHPRTCRNTSLPSHDACLSTSFFIIA